MKGVTILGISALYHDSAAAVIKDGEIIAAAQEERFSRKKHDNKLPFSAIDYCLVEAKTKIYDVDMIVYYDQPLLTLDRYLRGVMELGADADYQIEHSFDDIIHNRLVVDRNLRSHYGVLGKEDKLFTVEHHISHAASAFYPSPFESAVTLTIDGVGEWATTTIGRGIGGKIEIIEEIDYPHSIGLMYSAFTSFCGFRVNFGDYKFMGLAPYGEPVYYDMILDELIRKEKNGAYRLNLEYFDFFRGKYMTNKRFDNLFGGPKREAESRITRREMDIAASVQKITEEMIVDIAKHAKEVTGESKLVMAGGVALNCVANGKLLREGIFDDLWIQPAAGDAGGAIGCALYAWHMKYGGERIINKMDSQKGSFLGPKYLSDEIRCYLDKVDAQYEIEADREILNKKIAKELAEGRIVGWYQGRMEYGPRALGHRSIIADPRSEKMQSQLNLKIKYRESFRPFAPAVLADRVRDYFDMDHDSPYMLLVANVIEQRQLPFDKESILRNFNDDMLPLVNSKRSDIPAVTHIDYSARVQTVDENRNPEFYWLLKAFEKETGCGVLINTSFNVRGEPIVCTPKDAWLCFMRTEMDTLVLGDYILQKERQRELREDVDWRTMYELD